MRRYYSLVIAFGPEVAFVTPAIPMDCPTWSGFVLGILRVNSDCLSQTVHSDVVRILLKGPYTMYVCSIHSEYSDTLAHLCATAAKLPSDVYCLKP
nr:hypothetical protein [Tanacetum cinerariifolium]